MFVTCVQCGYCCRRSTCGFGQWDSHAQQCCYLKPTTKNQYECAIFEKIHKDPSSVISPAFGAGCCSSMNQDRQAVLRDQNQNHPLRSEFDTQFEKRIGESNDLFFTYFLESNKEDLFLEFLKRNKP